MTEWKDFVSGIYKAFPKKQANELVKQLMQLDGAGHTKDFNNLRDQVLIKVTQHEGAAGSGLLMRAAKAAPKALGGTAAALTSALAIRGVLKSFFSK